jgi:hypothetical protein
MSRILKGTSLSSSGGAREMCCPVASPVTTRPSEQPGRLSLIVLPELLAICQVGPGEPMPRPLPGCRFWSLTCTDDEWSIVLPADSVPAGWKAEIGWRCLKVLGPLDLTLTGVLADLSSTLARAAISVFAISTYETDYILVHSRDLEQAVTALCEREYTVT